MNASGMSVRLITFAAALVGHLRGGMAYVCQLTSALVSGISGSAQADAAIMTPLLVPAMEREGYRRDVAAAVVAGASIKGPIGPISIMFIVYGSSSWPAAVDLASCCCRACPPRSCCSSSRPRRSTLSCGGWTSSSSAASPAWRRSGAPASAALPVLAIPFIILGGIFSGVFTPTESASVAAVVAIALALLLVREHGARASCRGC